MTDPEKFSPEWFSLRAEQTRREMERAPKWIRDTSVAAATFPKN